MEAPGAAKVSGGRQRLVEEHHGDAVAHGEAPPTFRAHEEVPFFAHRGVVLIWTAEELKQIRGYRQSGLRSWILEGLIVRADVSQQDTGFDPLERETKRVARSALPDPIRSLDSLHPEGRMRGVLGEALECPIQTSSIFSGKLLRRAFESLSPSNDQRSRSPRRSFMDRNRFTRPLAMSSDASRSPRCHSAVQK